MFSFKNWFSIQKTLESISESELDELWNLCEKKEFAEIEKKAAATGKYKDPAAVAASVMWKAAKKSGADTNKVVKAAKSGKDIELDKMKKFK